MGGRNGREEKDGRNIREREKIGRNVKKGRRNVR